MTKRDFFSRTPKHVKLTANALVHTAVKRGQLERKPCENCGATKALAHHEDYFKPLEVIWLCPQCHADRHKELRGPKVRINLSITASLILPMKLWAITERVTLSQLTENLWISYLRRKGVKLPALLKEGVKA